MEIRAVKQKQRETYPVGGRPTPLKNMSSSVGIMTFPIYGKIKHVPNQQPAMELGLDGHPQWNYGEGIPLDSIHVWHSEWGKSLLTCQAPWVIVAIKTWGSHSHGVYLHSHVFFQICVSFLPSCLPPCSIVGICSSYAFSCFS